MQINFSGEGSDTNKEAIVHVRKYLRQLERGLKSGEITIQKLTIGRLFQEVTIECFLEENVPTNIEKLEIIYRKN